MKVVRIIAGEFGSNCWLVIDSTGDAVIVDPSPTVDKIEKALLERGCSLKYILLTHGHFDHMTSCDSLRDLTGAPLAIHKNDADCLSNSVLNAYRTFMDGDFIFRKADILLSDGEELKFGSHSVKVLHTPGHTEGSCCFIIDDCLFTGDTLFDCSVGRCDLAGGDANKLRESLENIAALDFDFRIFTGHGSVTTLQKQKMYNPYLSKI